jgi:hypothetical protein
MQDQGDALHGTLAMFRRQEIAADDLHPSVRRGLENLLELRQIAGWSNGAANIRESLLQKRLDDLRAKETVRPRNEHKVVMRNRHSRPTP